jgi:DNA-binding transcriptional MerR regulator
VNNAAVRRSGRELLSIGEVLAELRADFPDVTISKIRFLEAEGLVEPQRAPSGYRKFSRDDVERLRFVLMAQRDHYFPLRVIKEHLDALDEGREPPAQTRARLGGSVSGPHLVIPDIAWDDGQVTADTFRHENAELVLTRDQVLELAEVSDELLAQLEDFGLVGRRHGRGEAYDGDAVLVAKLAGELAGYGLEPRHLRALRTSADREVSLIEQVLMPLTRQRGDDSRARAEETSRELAALTVRLHALLVRASLNGGSPR